MNRGVLTGLGPGDAPDVLSGDAGQNALLVAGSRREIPFSLSSSTTPAIDASGYRAISIHVLTVATQNPLLQQSNDGVNWINLLALDTKQTQPTVVSQNLTVGTVWIAPVTARYVRVSNTGGSSTGVIELMSVPPIPWFQNVVVQTTVTVAGAASPADASDLGFNAIWTVNMAFNGSKWDRVRTPATFKTGTATTSGDTALWTPTTGKKFRVLRYQIEVTGDAATASGAEIDIVLRDATTAMALGSSLWVPSAGGTALGGYTTGWRDLGNGVLSAAANNVLNVNLSAALSAGKVRVNVCGTEE